MSEEAEKCHDELMRKADTIPQAIEIIDKHLQAYADEQRENIIINLEEELERLWELIPYADKIDDATPIQLRELGAYMAIEDVVEHLRQ